MARSWPAIRALRLSFSLRPLSIPCIYRLSPILLPPLRTCVSDQCSLQVQLRALGMVRKGFRFLKAIRRAGLNAKRAALGGTNAFRLIAWMGGTVAVALPTVGWPWSGYNGVTISWAAAYQSGKASPPGVEIYLTSTPADTEGCTNSNQGYAWIDFSSAGTPDGNALYATVLMAAASGKTVDIGVNGCASNGVPIVYAVRVHS